MQELAESADVAPCPTKETTMQSKSLFLAGVAVFAISAAQAAPTVGGTLTTRDHAVQLAQTPAGPPDTGTPRTTEGAPGQKTTPNNPTGAQSTGGTTGQGVG